MNNILSCRPQSYGRYHETAYSHMQAIGIRHVEIEAPAPGQVDATRDELSRFGISAASIAGSYNVGDPGAAEGFRSQVDAAVRLGAKRIFLSVKAGDLDRRVAYGRLREAGEIAATGGVTLILETHPDLIANGDIALETMLAVDHPAVRVNFDTANIYYYNRGIDGIEEMKKILDYIEGVHLKDTNGGFHAWHFPTLGEGIVDFKEVFRLTNGRGFHGPYTLEMEGIEGEELTKEQTEARVADSVAYLRRLGCIE